MRIHYCILNELDKDVTDIDTTDFVGEEDGVPPSTTADERPLLQLREVQRQRLARELVSESVSAAAAAGAGIAEVLRFYYSLYY